MKESLWNVGEIAKEHKEEPSFDKTFKKVICDWVNRINILFVNQLYKKERCAPGAIYGGTTYFKDVEGKTHEMEIYLHLMDKTEGAGEIRQCPLRISFSAESDICQKEECAWYIQEVDGQTGCAMQYAGASLCNLAWMHQKREWHKIEIEEMEEELARLKQERMDNTKKE